MKPATEFQSHSHVCEHYWTHLCLGLFVVEIVTDIPQRQQILCHCKICRWIFAYYLLESANGTTTI